MGNQDDLPNVTLKTLSSVMAKHDGLIQMCLKIVDQNIDDKFEVLLNKEFFEFKDVQEVSYVKRRVVIWQPLGESKMEAMISAIAVSDVQTIILYGRDGQPLQETPMKLEEAYTLIDLTINEMKIIYS